MNDNSMLNKFMNIAQDGSAKNAISILGSFTMLPSFIKLPAAIAALSWDIKQNHCKDWSCNITQTDLLATIGVDAAIYLLSSKINIPLAIGGNLLAIAAYRTFFYSVDNENSTQISKVPDYSQFFNKMLHAMIETSGKNLNQEYIDEVS